MESLSDAQLAALDVIQSAPEAWSWADPLQGEARDLALSLIRPGVKREAVTAWLAGLHAAGHSAETLASLTIKPFDYLEPFKLGVGTTWTFTPWGAKQRGIRLEERWQFEPVKEERYLGRRHRRDPETGWWICFDDYDDVLIRLPDEAAYWTTATEPRKVRLPSRCGESPLHHPELVPALADDPADDECPAARMARLAAEILLDDDGREIRLFAGGKPGRGLVVRRAKRKGPASRRVG